MKTNDDGTGNDGGRAWYDPACHECVMDAANPNGTETTAALEGIASRFGDGMAVWPRTRPSATMTDRTFGRRT